MTQRTLGAGEKAPVTCRDEDEKWSLKEVDVGKNGRVRYEARQRAAAR